VRIEGQRVEIGRAAYIDRFAKVGGGSSFDPSAFLKAGDWFHMGESSQINTARGVTVGKEFGCGIETKIFTHGAYLDAFHLGAPVQWAPVTIGDSVWLPNAWVNPGVTIGSNVIVAARSLVNNDLPSGCLAGGTPAKILRKDYLPRTLNQQERQQLIATMVSDAWSRGSFVGMPQYELDNSKLILKDGNHSTVFDLQNKIAEGAATPWTLLLKDQMRRNGIRFAFKAERDLFVPWQNSLTEI
jgi:acetyltransferase-like isoleucine patch superfamily enzyme